eukprot:761566-Pelagomonas_calceolata.AAC.1
MSGPRQPVSNMSGPLQQAHLRFVDPNHISCLTILTCDELDMLKNPGAKTMQQEADKYPEAAAPLPRSLLWTSVRLLLMQAASLNNTLVQK